MRKTLLAPLALLFLLSLAACKKDPVPPPEINDPELPWTVTVSNNPAGGNMVFALFDFTNQDKTGTIYTVDQRTNTVVRKKKLELQALDAKMTEIGGKTYYIYLVRDPEVYQIPQAGYVPGYYVIADENFNEIERVYLKSHGDIDGQAQPALDGHDFILLGENHYLAMAYYEKTVYNIPSHLSPLTNGVKVVANIIQEVRNGQVIWQWDSTEWPELYGNSVEGNRFDDSTITYDYAHMNSMFVDPEDDHLICSFRNLDQVLKLNRHTGEIVWRLGGENSDFPMTEDQQFLRQHHATLVDNNSTLLIFDNGDIDLRPRERILEFKLNEATKQIMDYKSLLIPNPPAFAQYMGSVQKEDNTYFIGGGSGNYIMEVDAITGEKIYEMRSPYSSYRAFKYPVKR